MVSINYKVSIVIRNKVSSLNIPFTEDKVYETNLAHENCVNKNFLLYKGNIFELFNDKIKLYAANNQVSINDLEVVSYNVVTDNKYAEIVFKKDSNHINLDIEVFAYYNDKTIIPTPNFIGCEVDYDYITWTLPNDGYAHKIYDYDGNFISDIPIGEIFYTEENLLQDTTYSRKLKSYNSYSISDFSNIVTAKTKKHIVDEDTVPFNPKYERNNNLEEINYPTVPMKAFKSGVGDDLDLKVYKPTETYFTDRFDVIANLSGVYYKDVNIYKKTSFDYRISCNGKYNYNETEGFVKFKLDAATTDKVKIRIYRYSQKDETVKAKITARVSYFKLESGKWIPKVKSISSDIYSKTFSPIVKYKTNSTAYLDTLSSLPMIATPIQNIIRTKALSDPEIKASQDNGKAIEIFDYKIYDDYNFNEDGNKYSPTKPRPFELAQNGTIHVHSSNQTIMNISSGLYVSGYAKSQLFDCEKIVTKDVDSSGDTIVILTKEEIERLIPTNISDRSYKYSGSNIVTKIEILECGATVKLSNVDLSSNNVLTATANNTHTTPVLTYNFNNDVEQVFISTKDIMSKMLKDFKYIYGYTLTIVDCSTNILFNSEFDSETSIYPGQIFMWEDDYMSSFSFWALSEVKVGYYEDVYPKIGNEPMHGMVNSLLNSHGESLRKDMIVQAPELLIPQEIYDVGFKLMIENVSPTSSTVVGKFQNQDDTGTTTVNGDFIQFSSEATALENREFEDLVTNDKVDTVILTDSSTITKNVVITKPDLTVEQENKYAFYRLKLISTSSDIGLSEYQNQIDFNSGNKVNIGYKIKVMKSAASRWSPLIHNGYYYINQNEYFMYSESNIEGTYEDNITYQDQYIDFKIKVNLSASTIGEAVKIYKMNSSLDYLANDNMYYKEYLYPLPVIDGKYYKKYSSVEGIIKEFHFDNIVSKFNHISWKLSNKNNDTTLFARSYDLTLKKWSDWSVLSNNVEPNIPLSNKMQLKVLFEPKVTESIYDTIETLSNYKDFEQEYDEDNSSNLYMLNGFIQAKTGTTAIFNSKILDYSIESELKVSSYYTVTDVQEASYVNIHVASSDDKTELHNKPNWSLMDGATTLKGRYFRYRIEFNDNVKIIAIYKHLKTTKTSTNIQGIKDIAVSVAYDGNSNLAKSLYVDKVANIKFNKQEQIISYNLLEDIEYPVRSAGYTLDNIIDIELVNENTDVDFTLKNIDYDLNNENIYTALNGWSKVEKGNNNFWILDNTDKTITYNRKSLNTVGYVSPSENGSWRINCILSSKEISNNPIGIILAYEKDSLGKEHILSLLVSPNRKTNEYNSSIVYSVYYNYGMENEKLIFNGTDLVFSSFEKDNWASLVRGITVNVVRSLDTFSITRSQNDEAVLNPGTLINIDLDSVPILSIFKNKSKFGFINRGQLNSTYSNISIQVSDKINSSIIGSSKIVQMVNKQSDYVEFIDNRTTVSPLAQQFAPIIVTAENGISLRRVYFEDEDGFNTLTNVETFNGKNSTFRLSYNEIDTNSIKVYVNGVLDTSQYELINNFLIVDKEYSEMDIIKIEYKIKNSFIVTYNVELNSMDIEANTSFDMPKAHIIYETNEYDNRRKIDYLSLNPIYNSNFHGFIYLSDQEQIPKSIRIKANPKFVYANGVDNIVVCAELLDEYDNPISKEELDISCSYGRIQLETYTTDHNGIVAFKYFATINKCIDPVIVEHKASGIRSEIKITNWEV